MHFRKLLEIDKASIRKCVFVSFLIFVFGVFQTPLFSQPLTETFVLREDFQGESLGRFASYPPAQDIGYEPSLLPTDSFQAPGGRALMRVIKPNRDGKMRFGFIRQTFLLTKESAKLSFSYFLNHSDVDDKIEIGIAGRDGCRYTKQIPAKSGGWMKEEVSPTEFRCNGDKALRSGVGVEAFYVVADLKRTDADITYRFLIDEINFEASRAANFEIQTPETVRIESQNAWVSNKNFAAGETLSLKASNPAKLKNVTWSIENQNGRSVATATLFDDGTHGDEQEGDGVWTNNSVYTFKQNDPTGIWKIRLHGTTNDGKKLITNVCFIRRTAPHSNHPRLYFNDKEKSALIARTKNPKISKVWEKIQKNAKTYRESGDLSHGGETFELLDKKYLLPSLRGYFGAMNQARFRIEYNSLVAYLNGDAEALKAAKEALLKVSNWSRWEPPWFTSHGQHTYYPAGLLAVQVAIGYDLLYDDLTENERSKIRNALIEKQIVPTYKEYVLDNRLMANTSNWIGHTVGGALVAAAAIADDIKAEEADGKFNIYLGGLLLKMERHIAASYLPDGSYGEGISYKEFDLETTAPAFIALKRIFGIDYWKNTHVEKSLSYSIYVLTNPIKASPDMGDTHPPKARTIAPLVRQTKDPLHRWFYERFEHNSMVDFLFFDDTVQPKPPQLPTSKIFWDKGNAVFRTGWKKDDLVFLYRAGANFNHNHADQGAFLLTAFGEPLITEAGWSDYYKDPYYTTFFTQAAGHNTVLVDGNPESQILPDTPQFKALDDYPRITDAITSEFYDTVGSDLTSAYQNRLRRYTRRIVFVKPHYFVVFDDLETDGKPAQFDFLLHLPNRAGIRTENLTATYKGEKASLAVRLFSPGTAKLSVGNGRIPYHIFSARTPAETPPQPAYLDFRTAKSLSKAQFLTALVTAKTENTVRNLIGQMSGLNGENFKGIRVKRGGKTDSVVFRTRAGDQTIRQGYWSADASVLVITESADNLELFAIQNSRFLRRRNQNLFSSDSPTNVAVNFNSRGIEAVCSAHKKTKINLFTGRNPARVLFNGRELKPGEFNFDNTDNTLLLAIPAGQHNLKITFEEK